MQNESHAKHLLAIEEVFSLYEQFGSADYIGEPVSQLEHMSQSAQLAIEAGEEDEVVLAAFFHDIGHICAMRVESESMNGYGTKSHEKIGADYLRATGFPERVAQLVESHVAAKRYLTFRFPSYYDQLSEASKQTLNFQGGRMTEAEAAEFERSPIFEASILLRKWDEMAKEVNRPTLPLAFLKEMAMRVLDAKTVN
jgi:phosphonate degradation associated HDIG domain protein